MKTLTTAKLLVIFLSTYALESLIAVVVGLIMAASFHKLLIVTGVTAFVGETISVVLVGALLVWAVIFYFRFIRDAVVRRHEPKKPGKSK